jgi:hypothetical protein
LLFVGDDWAEATGDGHLALLLAGAPTISANKTGQP